MYMTKNAQCCGLIELTGMHDRRWSCKDVIRIIQRRMRTYEQQAYSRFSHVILTIATRHTSPEGLSRSKYYRRLKTLQKFIEDNDLGTLEICESRKNPNSSNKVTPAIWSIDYNKTKKLKV